MASRRTGLAATAIGALITAMADGGLALPRGRRVRCEGRCQQTGGQHQLSTRSADVLLPQQLMGHDHALDLRKGGPECGPSPHQATQPPGRLYAVASGHRKIVVCCDEPG